MFQFQFESVDRAEQDAVPAVKAQLLVAGYPFLRQKQGLHRTDGHTAAATQTFFPVDFEHLQIYQSGKPGSRINFIIN